MVACRPPFSMRSKLRTDPVRARGSVLRPRLSRSSSLAVRSLQSASRSAATPCHVGRGSLAFPATQRSRFGAAFLGRLFRPALPLTGAALPTSADSLGAAFPTSADSLGATFPNGAALPAPAFFLGAALPTGAACQAAEPRSMFALGVVTCPGGTS